MVKGLPADCCSIKEDRHELSVMRLADAEGASCTEAEEWVLPKNCSDDSQTTWPAGLPIRTDSKSAPTNIASLEKAWKRPRMAAAPVPKAPRGEETAAAPSRAGLPAPRGDEPDEAAADAAEAKLQAERAAARRQIAEERSPRVSARARKASRDEYDRKKYANRAPNEKYNSDSEDEADIISRVEPRFLESNDGL